MTIVTVYFNFSCNRNNFQGDKFFFAKAGYPSQVLTSLEEEVEIPQDDATHHLLSTYLVPGTVLGMTPDIIGNPNCPAH